MSLQAKTIKALNAMAPFRDERHRLELVEDDQRLECELLTLDSLACALDRLSISTGAWADATLDELRAVSEKLSARLTYLLEPIRPIEIDAEGCTIQMRSKPPQQEEDRTSYYELLVRRGGAIALARYTKQPGDARQPIPVQVTREVLARLVADFSTAAAGKL